MSNPLQPQLTAYLLNSAWQIPLLFCAGWVLAPIARKVGTAAEHRIWVAVLLLQTLLPACSFDPLQHLQWLHNLLPWSSTGTATTRVSITFAEGFALADLHLHAAWQNTILTAYGISLAYFVAKLLWGGHKLILLRRRSTTIHPTGAAQRCWGQCSQRFAAKDATLGVSPEITGPITLGLHNKLILLPEAMLATLSEEDLHTVLAHEFAHLQRHDFAKNLAYELLRLPVAYHPAAWLTRSRITETREILCDRIAANAVAGSEQYARTLLRLAALLVQGRQAHVAHAIGIFDANQLERRIMRLTQAPKQIGCFHRLAIIATCATIGLVTCASALAMRTNPFATPQDTIAANSAKKPARVSAGIMQGQVLNKVNPTYPQAAKEKKIQGSIVLNATIGKEGTVENLQVVSGPEELRTSALDAVHQWTYKPYLLNGNPTEVETTITVTYSLAN